MEIRQYSNNHISNKYHVKCHAIFVNNPGSVVDYRWRSFFKNFHLSDLVVIETWKNVPGCKCRESIILSVRCSVYKVFMLETVKRQSNGLLLKGITHWDRVTYICVSEMSRRFSFVFIPYMLMIRGYCILLARHWSHLCMSVRVISLLL